jgi:hypothetical protein
MKLVDEVRGDVGTQAVEGGLPDRNLARKAEHQAQAHRCDRVDHAENQHRLVEGVGREHGADREHDHQHQRELAVGRQRDLGACCLRRRGRLGNACGHFHGTVRLHSLLGKR